MAQIEVKVRRIGTETVPIPEDLQDLLHKPAVLQLTLGPGLPPMLRLLPFEQKDGKLVVGEVRELDASRHLNLNASTPVAAWAKGHDGPAPEQMN